MSPRERRLLFALIAVLGVGGGLILAYQWFWVPYSSANRDIAKLIVDNNQKEEELRLLLLDKKQLDKARLLSLPPKTDVAVSEYSKFLLAVLQDSGLGADLTLQRPSASEAKAAAPTAGQGKKPGHQILTWQVRAKGELASLVKALEALQKMPLMHRVKLLDVTRIDTAPKATSNKLNINMSVDAMIVSKSETHPDNLQGFDLRLTLLDSIAGLNGIPSALGLLPWVAGPTGPVAQKTLATEALNRGYKDIAKRNIFVGGKLAPEIAVVKAPESDIDPVMMEYVRLETTNTDAHEAFFRNRIVTPSSLRVRAIPGSGFDTFRIMNEFRDKELLRGKVLRVDQRDVYFQVKDDVYAIHLGQTMAEALRRPLLDDAMKALELVDLYDEDFADQSPAAAKGKASQKKGKTKGR